MRAHRSAGGSLAISQIVVVNVYEIDDGGGPHWERVTVLDDAGQELARITT